MADGENKHAENAFTTLVSISEKSGNLRKYLKKDILESVSTLRKIFSKMRTDWEYEGGK
jgi:hypothetical protein